MATAEAKPVACKLVSVGALELENDALDIDYTGLVVLPGEVVMAVDCKAWNLRLHSGHNGKVLAISDKLQATPRDVCVINNMEVAVSLWNGHIQILSVKSTGDMIAVTPVRALDVTREFDVCIGVKKFKFQDKVVVSGRKRDTICWGIVAIKDGNIETIHNICKGYGASHLATSRNDDMVYLAIYGGYGSRDESGVYGFDVRSTSTQKFVYKHSDLPVPMGLSVDTRGFIFVCNWSPPCIHQLTDRGEPVSVHREGIPSRELQAIYWEEGLGQFNITGVYSNVVTRFRPLYSDQQGDHTIPEVLVSDERKSHVSEEISTQIKQGYDQEGNKGYLPFSPDGSAVGSKTEDTVLPSEMFNMDEHFQKLYREALATGQEEVYNIRVMIVGHHGVGKTSLTQRLLGEEVKEYETKPTEGIEVHARCCEIDHATGEWKRKRKTDECLLNDQRISSILLKYMSPPDTTEVIATDSVNGISPSKKQKLVLHDEIATTTPLDGDIQTISNKCTDSKSSKEVSIISEAETDIPISHFDNNSPTAKVQDEAEGRTYPEEIKNFVQRAQSLPIPKSRSSNVTLLDFAGQSHFYTTHQAFMSCRTLYLIVTDMSLPLTDTVKDRAYSIDVNGKIMCCIHEYVTYWLNSILSHVLIPGNDKLQGDENKTRGEGSGSVQGTTRNPPFVILVGTHSDKIPKDKLESTKKSYFNDIRIALKNTQLHFLIIDEDFAINNLGSDPNINALKTKIFEIAQKQKYWGQPIPARWIPLERALMEFKNRGIQVMNYADVKSLNENLQVRIEKPEELDLFLVFEHDIGNIVFFNTEKLREKVVLDPEWLFHGVRTWITSDHFINRHPELIEKWSAFKDTGRLTSTLIEKLWSSHSEIHQHREHLLDVMEKLNIITKPLQKERESGEEYYWVPCMVSMPVPDHVKKLQENKDTTKTSTLCFRSSTNFIHVGVFHRLLATCLSKLAPAKEGNTSHLFQGLCVFDLDVQQQLLLSLNDFVIQATVIRFTRQGQIPDRALCMAIKNDLYTALSEISDCLCPGSEFEICIKCKESSPLTNEGLHAVSTLRTYNELRCSTHREAHCVESRELLGFWEDDKKEIPTSVLPQHAAQPRERFTRLSSLLLDVGSEVLRKVLLYYSTTSSCTLDQYMKKYKPEILHLQNKKVLTEVQVNIIFPQSGQTNINEYDITLASALLNNIYPVIDRKKTEIINELREERNKLLHSSSTKLNEQDFQTRWRHITTTLANLSKLCKDPNLENNVQKKIQSIQQSGSCAILSKLTEISEELNKLAQSLRCGDNIETGMGIL